ncbi:unnamed protein product, partial [Heterotrigona itama]
MVHTHAEHTDNRPRLAWESFRSAAASSAAAGCCAPTDSLLAGDGATESDGTGQWESNRDAGEPGAGPSDGTNTLPQTSMDHEKLLLIHLHLNHLCKGTLEFRKETTITRSIVRIEIEANVDRVTSETASSDEAGNG